MSRAGKFEVRVGQIGAASTWTAGTLKDLKLCPVLYAIDLSLFSPLGLRSGHFFLVLANASCAMVAGCQWTMPDLCRHYWRRLVTHDFLLPHDLVHYLRYSPVEHWEQGTNQFCTLMKL